MYGLVIGLIILFCILLVLVILAQNAKGGGLSSQFGGSSASNIIGVKKTGDLLEKLTWGFVVAIMVLSLSTNLMDSSATDGNNILDDAAKQAPGTEAPATNPLGQPVEPADTTNP
jgi:preprotein translocase subunit SecG